MTCKTKRRVLYMSQNKLGRTLRAYFDLFVLDYFPPVLLAFFVGATFSSNLVLNLNLLLGVISISFLFIGYNSYNALSDKAIDSINKPYRPLPSMSLSDIRVKYLSYTFIALSLFFAFWINVTFLFLVIIAVILAIIYSHPRTYLKRHFIGIMLITVLLYAVIFPLLGWALDTTNSIPLAIILLLVVFGSGNSVLKDFEDMEGDKYFGVKTIPNSIGRKKAVYLILCSYTASIVLLLIYVWLNILNIRYIILIPLILMAIFNIRLLLNHSNKRAYRNAFIWGMELLALFELSIIIINLL